MITYISLVIFAVLPSLVWMFYYLQKDSHPEPKRFIFYVFVAGAISALLAYFFQVRMYSFLHPFDLVARTAPLLALLILILKEFFVVAFSEEFFKYLAVFAVIMRSPELDDPVDIVIYMITAALGFAAMENFFLLYSLGPDFIVEQMAIISLLRFAGATFLHALASGVLGLFLVYAYHKSNRLLVFLGFLIATAIHGTYNMLVVRIEESLINLPIIFIIFMSLAVIISLYMKKVEKMKSVCVIK